MSETALHRLAARVGLSRDWIDANARPQRVSDDVLRNVLEGLGHPADADEFTAHMKNRSVRCQRLRITIGKQHRSIEQFDLER